MSGEFLSDMRFTLFIPILYMENADINLIFWKRLHAAQYNGRHLRSEAGIYAVCPISLPVGAGKRDVFRRSGRLGCDRAALRPATRQAVWNRAGHGGVPDSCCLSGIEVVGVHRIELRTR